MPSSYANLRTATKACTAWLAMLALAAPAPAWNSAGHRVIAAIAYERLSPSTRAKVDALLARHPDYATLLVEGAPADPAARATAPASSRAAFLAASVWPDVIKGDARFFDDTRANARPAPLLPGFPSMARHTNWHYIDVPFSPDGTPLGQPQSPNARQQLRRLLKALGPNDPDGAYDLPWLLHLVGDVHQPLHCVSRFVQSQPKGDQGGNLVFVNPGRNLHAFWDDLAGEELSDAAATRLASEIAAEFTSVYGRNPRLSLDPGKWVAEGARLARTQVYGFGNQTGSRQNPIPLPAAYQAAAKQSARRQMALAGFRLAMVLSHEFK